VTKHHLPRGLDHRTTRNQNPPKAGQIREKRADTQVGTLRKEYGDHFAKGYRSDTHLGTIRQETGKQLAPTRPTATGSPCAELRTSAGLIGTSPNGSFRARSAEDGSNSMAQEL
jgi:hypothetical protein